MTGPGHPGPAQPVPGQPLPAQPLPAQPAAGGSLDQVVAELQAAVLGRVVPGASLASFTTFRLGGPAQVLVEASGEADLVATAAVAGRFALPLLSLGRGSNVLISDQGFPGVVLRLGRSFEWMRAEGEAVEAGGAAALPRVANLAAGRGLSGLEFAVAIPASVGGAVRMNAGAHASSVSQVLEWARVYRLGDPAVQVVSAGQLAMAYRSTNLGDTDIVSGARFRLVPADRQAIRDRMQRYREHRSATQPAEPRNAGSMFRNPAAPAGSAGSLIEQAGLKGFTVGRAEVSVKHGNFFVARPGACAQDVYQLLVAFQAAVREQAGVLLVPEVRLVGAFPGPQLQLPPEAHGR